MTRRQFVAISALGGAAAALGCSAGKRGNWEFLSEDRARTLTVLCDAIVPADEFPSASQAGVLTYIDRQLTRHYRRHQDTYREGLDRAYTLGMKHFGKEPAALSAELQEEFANDIAQQDRSFFELVRKHTFEGYYGSPRHGGNRDGVSWQMLGLADPPVRGRAQYDLNQRPPA
jgi:gluconate 2-dehydrogenase gamma chain